MINTVCRTLSTMHAVPSDYAYDAMLQHLVLISRVR